MEFSAPGKDPASLPVIVDMRTPERDRPPIEDMMVEVELGEEGSAAWIHDKVR